MTEDLMISIVDDDPSVCEGLIDLMNSIGFGATAYRSANAFLQSESASTAACLISDVQMPGIGGFELHDRLVKSGRKLPTILITAYPKDSDRARAMRLGIHCYLAKPFNETDLLDCIRLATGTKGS